MSKIICDVCGTSYPETATQCPICGSARPSDVESVVSSDKDTEATAATGYHYVKGGRFSSANVRKRARAQQRSESSDSVEEMKPEVPRKKANKAIVVVVVLLLVGIVAMVGYIAVRFFMPSDFISGFFGGKESTTAVSSCNQIQVAQPVVELTQKGATHKISVVTDPVDTTDAVTYVSEDTNIATVDASGNITAVSAGQTVITITCGNVSAQCNVVCKFEMPTEPTTEPATQPPTEPPATEPPTEAPTEVPEECVIRTQYGVNRYNDATVSVGDTLTFDLTNAAGDKKDVTWTLKNGSCCTLTGNQLKAVAQGEVTVSTTYGGQEYTFIVRVR